MTQEKPSYTRLGLHYFPDTLHYRDTDIRAWLPELQALGISWLVMQAPSDRAIPEDFVRSLVNAGIEPILHFPISIEPSPVVNEFLPLLTAYSSWGVRYIVLFDRPNCRQAWTTESWAKSELVESFLERFLPITEKVLDLGLIPVLPPLEPGGDYWDLAFLRAVLESLQQRGETQLLDKLVLGAYASSGERALDWGMGGPECWPGARPYQTPPEEQDQRGFYIYDWYRAISVAVTGRALPILLFGVGSPGMDLSAGQNALTPEVHLERNITLTQWIAGLTSDPNLFIFPTEILAGNLWLMAASKDSLFATQAWYPADGRTLAMVGMLRQAHAMKMKKKVKQLIEEEQTIPLSADVQPQTKLNLPIAHYLLIPDKSKADYYIKILQPFIKRYFPTVGFSESEAGLAARVTVISDGQEFSQERIEKLRTAGCKVVCLNGTGTELAHFMAML